MLLERFAPVLSANARQARTIARLSRDNERLRREAKKQEDRAWRWRRTALELAPRVSPKAMDHCLIQVQSEEIQDLPEVKR